MTLPDMKAAKFGEMYLKINPSRWEHAKGWDYSEYAFIGNILRTLQVRYHFSWLPQVFPAKHHTAE